MPVDVVGIGENSVDHVLSIAGPLLPNGKHAITRRRRSPGGQVATTLCTCAALGLSTKYVGTFGHGVLGVVIRDALAERGVDLADCHTRAGSNRSAVIIVDEGSGTRTILWDRHPALALSAADLPYDALRAARLTHVDAVDIEASIAAADVARQAGRMVTIDADTATPQTAALIAAATHPIVAEHLPMELTGEPTLERALRALRRPHHAMVCVTLGSRGAMLLAGETIVQAPPPRVDVVDTTGAGDVFRGAFIYALLRGDAPADILTFANAAAAASCTREGAIDSVPTLADITRLLS